MDDRQIGSAICSIIKGREIQLTHPEVVGMYVRGDTYEQIAVYLDKKGMKGEYLSNAVGYAIRGHNGELGIPAYDGLLSVAEQKKVARDHHSTTGLELKANGVGLFSLSPEQRKEFAGLAGKIGGQMSRKNSKGIHAQTREQYQEVSRRGVISKGVVPWDSSEESSVVLLAQCPEYIFQSGGNKGRTRSKELASAINNLYYNGEPVRTPAAVNLKLRKLRNNSPQNPL